MFAFFVAATAALSGCYGPVNDRSRVSAVEILPGGRIAVAFHLYRFRPAAGLAAYPDGGPSRTLADRFIISVVGPSAPVRKLDDIPSETLGGAGSVSLRWFPNDPQHLYISRSGQQTISVPIRELSEQRRYPLAGGKAEHIDLRAELAGHGRKLGLDGFGDFAAIAPDGSLVVGATIGDRKEIWLRNAKGVLKRIASCDRFDALRAHYLYYSNNGPPFTTFAVDLRTLQSRPLLRYNLQNTQQEWQALDDPAFRELNQPLEQVQDAADVGGDGQSVRYIRNGSTLWEARIPH